MLLHTADHISCPVPAPIPLTLIALFNLVEQLPYAVYSSFNTKLLCLQLGFQLRGTPETIDVMNNTHLAAKGKFFYIDDDCVH